MALDPRGFPGYLFDLDGTLIDTAPDICAAVNHALNQFGFDPVAQDLVRHWVGHGGRHCIEQAVAAAGAESPAGSSPRAGAGSKDGFAAEADGYAVDHGASTRDGDAVDAAMVDDMLDRFLDHYAAHIADSSRPYPHVVDTLEALSKRGAKLAVVTNKRIALTRKLLDALELTAWFDCIVGGDTAPNPKPAPDPILFACNEIGLSPPETLFVGDSLTDVNASRAAGCPVVCVPDGYNHRMEPERLGADSIIESFRALV